MAGEQDAKVATANQRLLLLAVVSLPHTMTTTSDISQCLQNTLSSDPNTRISAELKLGELLTLPGAPSITLSDQAGKSGSNEGFGRVPQMLDWHYRISVSPKMRTCLCDR
jgi:hypothetical protein